MGDLTLRQLDGGQMRLAREELAASVGAPIVDPRHADYDATRSLWNAMIDSRPGAIVRVQNEDDVAAAVRFVAERGLRFAVRAGGHGVAGLASCEGGLVIDLRALTRLDIDAGARRARVGPGLTLGELDAATQAFGLAVPVGINSTTGLAGLTLGGGFGWISGKYGLTVDNLFAARVVTAAGKIVTASRDENSDLFWALRGGGGNFGIVTEFAYRLNPVGPQVYTGLFVHPLDAAASVLAARESAMASASDDLSCWSILRKAPPLPFIGEEWHGRDVLILAACYIGDVDAGPAAMAPLARIGAPVAKTEGPMAFVAWQAAFDPLAEAGARNYWKSHDIEIMDADAIGVLTRYAAEAPGAECEAFIGRIDGAVSRVGGADTPWPNRRPHYVVNVHTRWRDAADDDRFIAWAKRFYDELAPHATGSRYVNFISEGDDAAIVRSAYGDNYERLLALKAEWDPDNLFRSNVNLAAG